MVKVKIRTNIGRVNGRVKISFSWLCYRGIQVEVLEAVEIVADI